MEFERRAIAETPRSEVRVLISSKETMKCKSMFTEEQGVKGARRLIVGRRFVPEVPDEDNPQAEETAGRVDTGCIEVEGDVQKRLKPASEDALLP